MLYPRLIPCLLIHENGLYKTTNFKNPKYVGDPINAVKIFNDKQVDELIVLDIDASVNNNEPNYKLIENLAFECRMPLCYGGGIKTLDQALHIFSLGVEKISLSSEAVSNITLINSLSSRVGSQSVVVVIDVKKNRFTNQHKIFTHNGKIKTNKNLLEFINQLQDNGVGEIVINSIDNDGSMKGYDINLIEKIYSISKVPITVLGGAGSLSDFSDVISKTGIIGLASGSFFVFKGKFKAVLINYPNIKIKEELLTKNLNKY